QIKKSYGNKIVLKNISFSVQKGSIHGFIGPNGAGKTTTLNCLMGGVKPNSGGIYLAGQKIGEDELVNQKIGFMTEQAKFTEDLKVEDFIYLTGNLRNLPTQKVEARLRQSDLNHHRFKKCGELSTGWKKILLYFVSVIHDPDILVLDEPTSGLDPSYRGILLSQLEQVRERGGTILISSHILSDLQKLVDSATLIDKGKIVYTGKKPADIEEMYNKLYHGKSTIHQISNLPVPLRHKEVERTSESIKTYDNNQVIELVQELKDYEIKKSPLSVAARAKVIKRNGGGYQSSRMSSEDIALMQRYGPGFWDDFVKPIASGALVVASVFPPTAAFAAPVALGVMGAGVTVAGIGHAADSKGLKKFGKGLAEIGSGAHDFQEAFSSYDAPLNQYANSRNRR
ncbi:6433_t:CDS:2, partial [Funneliformis geosporum]